MSLIKLKSKTEPKYINKPSELKRRDPLQEVTEEKTKAPINSASSLQIGNGVTITGSIKADNEVTIEGTLDGDVDCHCLMISKTGNIKGKVKTETMTIEGKAEGEITINDLLQIKSSGCPIAKTVSPILTSLKFPNETGLMSFGNFATSNKAKSFSLSILTILAL